MIAPERRHDFIQELQTTALAQFSNPSELTGPIDEFQVNRWQGLLADATGRGATAIPLLNRDLHREFAPHILLDVPEDALVLHEEIFGPLLPIIAIADTAEAIHFINRQPNPLALYWFGKNKQNLRLVLDQTRSGGVCINETVLQATIEDLPFGGIGASGLGAYHGKAGFDALSHQKSILQVRGLFGLNILRGTSLARPPYGKGILRLLRWIK